jgi:hypothetical protein
MEVSIKHKDIIDRCEQLSSFEARGKVDAQGQSRYLDIHINEIDQLLINQYIDQARAMLEEKFDRMITESVDVSKEQAYPFDSIISGSGFASYEGKITNEFIDLTGVKTRVCFLSSFSGSKFDVFGIEVIDTDHPSYGMIYTNDEMLGYEYESNPNNERFYIDKNGTTYARTDGSLSRFDITKSFTWTIRTDTRWAGASTFTKHATEAITSYVMAQWLAGRLDERVQFYEALFASSLAMATKNLFTKQAP